MIFSDFIFTNTQKTNYFDSIIYPIYGQKNTVSIMSNKEKLLIS